MLQVIRDTRRRVYEWELAQRRKLYNWALRKLGANHPDLDDLLKSQESDMVRQVVEGVFQNYSPHLDDRPFMERAYLEGQKYTRLSGWPLRFLVYYWAGVKLERWD